MTRIHDSVLHTNHEQTIYIDAGRDHIRSIHRRTLIEDNDYYTQDEVCDILSNDGIDDMREHIYDNIEKM